MIHEIYGELPDEGDILGQTGIPFHTSMDIHDPSKIQTFMDSPRKYFFSYVLGWRKVDPNIHLVFGSGWHRSMEHLLLSLNKEKPYSTDVISEAYDLFLEEYNANFPMDLLGDEHPSKNPGNAFQALIGYVNTWISDIGHYRTLYTEIAGSVPITDTRVVHLKMDSILERVSDGSIISMEHKTTGRKTQAWLDQWELIIQPLIYNHALRVIFQDRPVRGVVINGAILRKGSNEFLRIPVSKSDAMMREGLWKTDHILDQIKWNWENLLETSPEDDVLPAFHCNGTSCSKFGCEYAPLCASWANPLAKVEFGPPPGFKQEYWDPRREDTKIKYRIDEKTHIAEATNASTKND